MPEFNDLFRSYQAAGWRTNYDAQKASPTAGLTPGVYRAWCVRNLLALLDDRNLTGITGFQDILDVNVAFRLPEFMAQQFNQIHAVHNPFLAEFGLSSFMQILSGGNVLTVRRDVFLTDGATVVSNGGSWVDTAERDRRLDLVDADSGRAWLTQPLALDPLAALGYTAGVHRFLPWGPRIVLCCAVVRGLSFLYCGRSSFSSLGAAYLLRVVRGPFFFRGLDACRTWVHCLSCLTNKYATSRFATCRSLFGNVCGCWPLSAIWPFEWSSFWRCSATWKRRKNDDR